MVRYVQLHISFRNFIGTSFFSLLEIVAMNWLSTAIAVLSILIGINWSTWFHVTIWFSFRHISWFHSSKCCNAQKVKMSLILFDCRNEILFPNINCRALIVVTRFIFSFIFIFRNFDSRNKIFSFIFRFQSFTSRIYKLVLLFYI
jgi:hypothetical protein